MNSVQHNHTDIFFDSIKNLNKFVENKTVLDFGSGDGYASEQFHKLNVNHIDSVDLRYLESNHKNHKHYFDLVRLRYDCNGFEDRYDLIWSHHCFEHIPNYFEYLMELRRALKESGFLFLGLPNAGYTNIFSPGHINNFTMPSLIAILKVAGFNVERGFYWSAKGQLRVIVQKGKCNNYPERMNEIILKSGRCPADIYEDNNRLWI